MTPMMNNYYFQHQFPVKQIIYPTPPYMSIRRDEIEVFRFPVRSRKLMDMIKNFDPKDITYIEDSSSFGRYPYFKADATGIHDSSNKYFVISGDRVLAKYLKCSVIAAKFKIVFRETRENRFVITLQVQNQDLYLSYNPNPDRQLKALPLGQNPDFEKNKEFFFYLSKVNGKSYSIESAKQPGSFISTSPDMEAPVTVQPTSDTRHREFDFDAGYNIGGNMYRPNIVTKFSDGTIYWYNDRTFQDKYQSILARDNYMMDATSLALDRSYRWPRQDNLYQSYHQGWRCI